MKRNATNALSSASRIASHVIRGGKKTGIAIALVAIMAVMWVRVLTGQKPKSAEAKPKSAQRTNEPKKKEPVVRLIDLPVEPGRNDRIHRDFFTTQDWSHFSSGSKSPSTGPDTEVQTAASNRTEEVINRLAKTLKLEAVVFGSEDPQAIVNDRRIRVGGTFTLNDGACDMQRSTGDAKAVATN
jgi:hypothetical protein